MLNLFLINDLINLTSPQVNHQLKQYLWWSEHSFIKSISYDSEQEFDDSGGWYAAYHLQNINLIEGYSLLNYLIKKEEILVINQLFKEDNEPTIRLEDLAIKTNLRNLLYSRAQLIVGNEEDYDLHHILVDYGVLDLSLFYQSEYLTVTTRPTQKEISIFVDNLVNDIKGFILNHGR